MTQTGRALVVGALLALIVTIALVRFPPARFQTPRDNVLVVVIDALRPDYLGHNGFVGPISPHMDQFTEHAMVFERAYVTAPWTLPSIASLLTGVEAPGHGVGTETGVRWTADRLPSSADTLAEIFERSGYRTGAFVANDWLKHRGFDQGFHVARIGESLWSGRALNSAVLAWLEPAADSRPSFTYLHYMDVHSPYRIQWKDFEVMRSSPSLEPDALIPPARVEFLRQYEGAQLRWPAPSMDRRVANWRAVYAAGVMESDRIIGELIDGLRARGLLETTTVIVTSDHGEELFEHGDLGHGTTLFEEVLRVPLFVRPAGPDREGARTSRLVSLIDVVPWLRHWLARQEARQPREAQPRLDPGQLGATSVQGPSRRFLHASGVSENAGLLTIFDDRFRLIVDEPRRTTRLFDLTADPRETRDVAGEHPDLVRVLLEQALTRHRALMLLHDRTRQVGAPPVALPPETLERLKSLGYVR